MEKIRSTNATLGGPGADNSVEAKVWEKIRSMASETNKMDFNRDGAIFAPLQKASEGVQTRYPTFDNIPVCEFEGGPVEDGTGNYLADPFRAQVLPAGTEVSPEGAQALLVPAHVLDRYKNDAESDYNVLQNPDFSDPALLRNFQQSLGNLNLQSHNGGTLPYKLCRSELRFDETGWGYWVYKGNKLFSVPCAHNPATYQAVNLPADMSYRDVAAFLHATQLSSAQYCFGDHDQEVPHHIFLEKDIPLFDNVIARISEGGIFVEEGEGETRGETARKRNEALATVMGGAIKEARNKERKQRIAIANQLNAPAFQEALHKKGMKKQEILMDETFVKQAWLMGGMIVASTLSVLYASGKISLPRNILRKIRNISDEAQSGALGEPRHWMGMNDDLKKMAEIMGAPEINSIRTLGPNGSGKSARWEALAVCIEHGIFPDGTSIPDHLRGKRVYELNPKSHIMGDEGSSYIGNAERFVRQVATKVSKGGNILHVDEAHGLHNLAVTTASGGSGGAEEGLKPMMARKGEGGVKARLGFSSTEEEYNRSLGTNRALHGRTVPVYVSEPTPEETVAIMIYKKDLYEKDAGREINESALKAAVELTQSDTDTHYPRKAEKLLGLAYEGVLPGGTITEKEVREAAEIFVAEAARKSARDAISVINDRELAKTPEEQANIRSTSIEKAIDKVVENFDEKRSRLIQIVEEAWGRALERAPMTRSLHPPSEDPLEAKYGVPPSFTAEILNRIAQTEGLTIKTDYRKPAAKQTPPAFGEEHAAAGGGKASSPAGRAKMGPGGILVRGMGGGGTFFIGMYGAKALKGMATGDFSELKGLKASDIAKSYAALTVGGGGGQVGLKSLAARHPNSKFLNHKITGRGLPLLSALLLNELVMTGTISPEQIPLTMGNVLAASSATHGIAKLAKGAAKSGGIVRKIGSALKLTKAATAAAAPASGGTSVVGTLALTLLEFTILEALAAGEQAAFAWWNKREMDQEVGTTIQKLEALDKRFAKGEEVFPELLQTEMALAALRSAVTQQSKARAGWIGDEGKTAVAELQRQRDSELAIPLSQRGTRRSNHEINTLYGEKIRDARRDVHERLKALKAEEQAEERMVILNPAKGDLENQFAGSWKHMGDQIDRYIALRNRRLERMLEQMAIASL